MCYAITSSGPKILLNLVQMSVGIFSRFSVTVLASVAGVLSDRNMYDESIATLI